MKYSCGKRDLGFCNIVSGGFFGQNGDIVVDSIHSPTFVFGVAQGNGLLKRVLSAEDEGNVTRIKNKFTIDKKF